jgi:hypothetical protein
MGATWVKIAGIGVIVLAFGCRTPQPNLKPPKTAEVLSTPPSEKRFDTPVYPKEAFVDRDAIKKMDDTEFKPTAGGVPGAPSGMPGR